MEDFCRDLRAEAQPRPKPLLAVYDLVRFWLLSPVIPMAAVAVTDHDEFFVYHLPRLLVCNRGREGLSPKFACSSQMRL